VICLINLESNKTIIKEFINATNNKDWGKLSALVDNDFVRHSSSGTENINSREKLIKFHQEELLVFPDSKETIILLVEEGEFVAARLNFQGTQLGKLGPYPPSGRTLNADFNCIFRITNGKIKESWVEYDNLNGLIQLGHFNFPKE